MDPFREAINRRVSSKGRYPDFNDIDRPVGRAGTPSKTVGRSTGIRFPKEGYSADRVGKSGVRSLRNSFKRK